MRSGVARLQLASERKSRCAWTACKTKDTRQNSLDLLLLFDHLRLAGEQSKAPYQKNDDASKCLSFLTAKDTTICLVVCILMEERN